MPALIGRGHDEADPGTEAQLLRRHGFTGIGIQPDDEVRSCRHHVVTSANEKVLVLELNLNSPLWRRQFGTPTGESRGRPAFDVADLTLRDLHSSEALGDSVILGTRVMARIRDALA